MNLSPPGRLWCGVMTYQFGEPVLTPERGEIIVPVRQDGRVIGHLVGWLGQGEALDLVARWIALAEPPPAMGLVIERPEASDDDHGWRK